MNIVNKILHFNPKYLGHQKIRFKSNRKRKLYVSVYRNDYGVGVSIGIDCKVMKKQWYGRWTHVRNWGHGIYYGIPELVVKQSIKVPNYNNKFTPNLKKILNDQWKKSMAYDDFAKTIAAYLGKGCGILVITHDMRIASMLPGRKLRIEGGVLHECE